MREGKKKTPRNQGTFSASRTQVMGMMSIYISSSPHVLLHNHTSVTMVGSTHRFERAVQIGPGNHSLWPTLACFDLQRPQQRRAQPLFVDSSLAASTHCVAATQVPWCTTAGPRWIFGERFIPTRPPSSPPPPLCLQQLFVHFTEACLEIGAS